MLKHLKENASKVNGGTENTLVHQNILAFVKGDAGEAAKIHEQVLVFLKGNSKEANADLGDFRADNCILPEMFE